MRPLERALQRIRAGWRRDDLLVALALALLAGVLAGGGWLWRADHLAYDAALAWSPRPMPDDVVIVAIDDASLDAIGRWPWKRSVHATLMQRLAAAPPRAVLLDLLLSEPDPDPQQDALLARALQPLPVVMPVAWQALPGEGLRVLEPVPVLKAAVRLGTTESPVDDDGVVRRAFLEAGPADRPFEHAAVALLRAAGQPLHPAVAVEREAAGAPELRAGWPRQGRFNIRFGGAPGSVPRVSYVDVLTGAVPAARLAGRTVLIGMTAQGLGDTLATPVNADQRAMPGVEVQAHTLVTLREGWALRSATPAQAALLSAGLLLLLVAAFGVAGTRAALLLALASWPAALLASLLALRAGWWCSPASFMLAAALAYPLWSWRRLEGGVAELDREIGQLAAEPGLLPPRSRAPAALRGDRLATRLAALHTAAETVRTARRFLADALAGLPTAMLVDDGAGRVLLANEPAARLFEVDDAADLNGLDLARLLAEFDCQPPTDWPAVLEQVRRHRRDLTVQARHDGQGDHLIQAQGVPMHGGTRIIVALSDVEPIRRAEREREEMLAFVSHDLRSPATSIALLADLQRAGRGTMEPEALLAEIARLARRTQSLAEDFVQLARAEQRPLQRTPMNWPELLAEVVTNHQPQATAAGVRLQATCAGAAGPALDRALLQRAVGNLVSNALRFSPAGAAVQVVAESTADGGCRIVVSDQGAGLADEALERLNQGHDGLLPQAGQGVGFGLLFVQRVARRLGGRLAASRGSDGRGAVFELSFEPWDDSGSGNP